MIKSHIFHLCFYQTHTQTKFPKNACVSVSSAPSSVTQGFNEKVWMTVCVLLPTLSPALLPSRLARSHSQFRMTERTADSSVFRN